MVFERSTSPESCRALAPAVAIAMASSHMRMRFQSPMLTPSDTAPMVQKCVLLPTAPKTKASANAPHTTVEARVAGLASLKQRRPAYFFDKLCLACSDAELAGYFLTRVRSVSRAALLWPISACELAILSSASGALEFSGHNLTTFCCAAIAAL